MKSKMKLIFWAILAAGILGLIKYFDLQSVLKEALNWIQGLGPWGFILFIIVYILATVLFLPGFVLTLGAGVLYGVVKGSVIVSVASTLGATSAFLIGRYLARDWISKKTEGNNRFKAIDEAVGKEGWKIVGLTRLSPIFPFNLLNYSFGVTRVSLRDYFFASWIGMMPGTVMYVYIGSLAGNLASLNTADRARTPAEWVLYTVGLVATVVVSVYVTRLAKKALERRVAL